MKTLCTCNGVIISGKGIGGARSSVDASVVIQVGETKSETKTIQGTTNPTWNEEISVPIEDSSKFLSAKKRGRHCLNGVQVQVVLV